ncbi:MAG: precorrin-3B C(17)-methyltransferase [Deltaproteobacteria bacterium]|nr:precorrin-3B C(17)-methyltransferase [Deltaproteobacteria bacterium]
MLKEEKARKGDGSGGKGTIYVIGIGPGGLDHLTGRAKDALEMSERIVGYTRYVDLIAPLAAGKEVFSTGMTHEVERCRKAIEFAAKGSVVSVVSSGDAGIYGMAGLILELVNNEGIDGIKVEVIPGIPAFVSAAAILGAPLMHDFASISLSDLLTDWRKIEERVEAAAKADFVIVFYNPKSSKRVEGLKKAMDIVGRYRGKDAPLGIVRNATREGEEAVITTVGEFDRYYGSVDMLTIIVIGNSSSYAAGGRIITPRGYNI